LVETSNDKPLWVRIIFEIPEFIQELLLHGSFLNFRKIVIDISTNILLIFENNNISTSSIIKYLLSKNLLFLEWINNNWRKKILLEE
jgi:hypothetical protein